jgi:acyl carrier protein
MTDEFGRGLAEILDIDQEILTPDLPLNEENWDSMAMISTIGLIDETYGITVPVERLTRCCSVGELTALIDSIRTEARR